MSFTLGNLPERVQDLPGSELDQYFRVARGSAAEPGDSTRRGRWRDDQVV